MGNITTLAVTEQDYRAIINVLEHGYVHNGVTHRPNYRVAFALKLEYATGLRVSDIVKLRQNDIVRDGNRYRLDISEKKTKKKRTSTISQQIYDCIDKYCADHKIASDQYIVGGTTFGIQKQLKYVCDYLGMDRIGTHSMRKAGAQKLLKISNYNVTVVQTWLNHSSPNITYTYLASGNRELEEALDKMEM